MKNITNTDHSQYTREYGNINQDENQNITTSQNIQPEMEFETQRKLKPRHIQMIAIGGVIGIIYLKRNWLVSKHWCYDV